MMSIQEIYRLYQQHPSLQTDTRKLQSGDIFFALKGPNFNGNTFAEKALEAGAAYSIVDEKTDSKDERIILVEDVLQTLQQLAGYHRSQFSIPFIAITGSNGKTTTKELIHQVLSTRFITYTTEGNLNNHIGIPLTLLKIKPDAQMAVIEMGANHLKEIESYCQYTKPTHGIITNCGKAHMEGFGSEENIKIAKGELYDYVRKNEGTVFAFDDYDYFHSMTKGIKEVVWYGTKNGSTIGKKLQIKPFLSIQLNNNDIYNTQLIGDYNLPNVLCAIAVGKYFGVEDAHIQSSIENYAPSNSRSQLKKIGSNHFIIDAYNANPTSMKAAIENLSNIDADKKVLLLGAMKELGENSVKEHQDLVELIKQYNWLSVVLVGGDFEKTTHPFYYFSNTGEARKWLEQQHFEDTYFLLKGSRGIAMENVLA